MNQPLRLSAAAAAAVSALALFAACSGVILPVAENTATDPDGGSASHPDGTAALGEKCCPIDDAPGCCMKVGGTKSDAGFDSCLGICDGMPVPSDPGWVRRPDQNGCDVWENPNGYLSSPSGPPGTHYCGEAPKLDGGASGCTPACANGQVCVSDQIIGGAFSAPDDAGACPPGRHLDGNQCVLDPTYHCVVSPPDCASALVFDCACAQSVCTSQSSCPFQCKTASETQVNCVCAVP